MKKIGLDVGDKTIASAGYHCAGSRIQSCKGAWLVREYECVTIVVGLPLGLDRNRPQTEKVRGVRTMLENSPEVQVLHM